MKKNRRHVMKRSLPMILVILLVFSIGACAANRTPEPSPTPTPSPSPAPANNVTYKDGTYTGEGDKRQYGYENATVVITNGKIETITLRRLENDGKEVNYDDWTGKEVNGKVRPNLKKYRTDLADQMVEKQTYNVDIISGATDSSKGWQLAVQRALEKAKK
jgi:uncharacterized protein with FMN-binding domain